MAKPLSPSVNETRSSPRFKDRSPLYVRGMDAFGLPFSEIAEVNDISEGGISFVMQSPVWVDSVLNLNLGHLAWTEGHSISRRKAKVRVLRVDHTRQGQHLVAGCFES
jgi:hypothetical protein